MTDILRPAPASPDAYYTDSGITKLTGTGNRTVEALPFQAMAPHHRRFQSQVPFYNLLRR